MDFSLWVSNFFPIFVLQIQIRRFSIAQVGEAENQLPISDFSPKEYHATEREYRKSIPFYDAALLPILRHNLIFLYTDMGTGATLIAPYSTGYMKQWKQGNEIQMKEMHDNQ